MSVCMCVCIRMAHIHSQEKRALDRPYGPAAFPKTPRSLRSMGLVRHQRPGHSGGPDRRKRRRSFHVGRGEGTLKFCRETWRVFAEEFSALSVLWAGFSVT
jgi:hypothetical protein